VLRRAERLWCTDPTGAAIDALSSWQGDFSIGQPINDGADRGIVARHLAELAHDGLAAGDDADLRSCLPGVRPACAGSWTSA